MCTTGGRKVLDKEVRTECTQQHQETNAQLPAAHHAACEGYEHAGNSWARKLIKLIRLFKDRIKYGVYHVKELLRLGKKAVFVLRNDGFSAMRMKISQYLSNRHGANQLQAGMPAGAGTAMCFRTSTQEPDIPLGWVKLQPNQPLISVVIAVKDANHRKESLVRAIESLLHQKYQNFQILLVCSPQDAEIAGKLTEQYANQLSIKLVDAPDTPRRSDYWDAALAQAEGSWIAFMEQEDELTPNALAYVLDGVNEFPEAQLFVLPDDRVTEDGEHILPDYKVGLEWGIGGVDTLLHVGVLQKNGCLFADGSMDQWLRGLKKEQIQVIPWIACHGQMIESVWQDEVSVRSLAFYLPQFHEIPENNEWWGKGFTEWTNVRKAQPLYPGHHQPRRAGELGYYDLGDETGDEVQRKQIALAKEYGLGGFCYYYYWFDGGKRLLEKPLDRHLNDKSLDFPFCLCWANENWTRRWDGLENEVLMPQTYENGWAEHFILDMLPYLFDERYIRIEGAPYILIYNLDDIKNPADSINTWRRIAAEHGIERLHISAVRRTVDAQEFERSGYTIDSLTDFPPHLLGQVGVDHDDPAHFGLPAGQVKDYCKAVKYHVNTGKQGYTYFRTAMLEWDNTARKGKNAYIFENYSVNEYIKWLYAGKRYTLRQNKEGEDLVFINAWNEWAEGTYLEPSEPGGRSALEATRKALRMR